MDPNPKFSVLSHKPNDHKKQSARTEKKMNTHFAHVLLALLVGATDALEASTIRNLRQGGQEKKRELQDGVTSFSPINILYKGDTALAVASDSCGGLLEVRNVRFDRIRPYGKEDQITNNTKMQWIYHEQGGILESVHCPGKVLDIRASNCNRGEVILYGLHGAPNQQWLTPNVESETFGFGPPPEGVQALESVECAGQYLQIDFPLRVQPDLQQEFKSSAFTFQPAATSN